LYISSKRCNFAKNFNRFHDYAFHPSSSPLPLLILSGAALLMLSLKTKTYSNEGELADELGRLFFLPDV
jgi:hypothetical protein